jgi:hypothetical protein
MIVYDPTTIASDVEAAVETKLGAGPLRWPSDDFSPVSLYAGRMLGTAFFRSVDTPYQNAFFALTGLPPLVSSVPGATFDAAADAPADGTRYTVELDAWNGDPDLPSASHTFAVFVAERAGAAPEVHTISWLPADATVRALPLQTGHNFTLEETLAIARDRPILRYGPFVLARAAYDRARARITFLESGGVRYKMIDWATRRPSLSNRPGGAINCIHAVSDVVGPLDTGELWGDAATRAVVAFFGRTGAIRTSGTNHMAATSP